MAFEAGQLVVKLSIDDKEAKDKIKNIQKEGIVLSTTSDKAADKFREAADKLTKVLDKAGGSDNKLLKNIGIAVSAIGGYRFFNEAIVNFKTGDASRGLNSLGKSLLYFAGTVNPTVRGLNTIITTIRLLSAAVSGTAFAGVTAASLKKQAKSIGLDSFVSSASLSKLPSAFGSPEEILPVSFFKEAYKIVNRSLLHYLAAMAKQAEIANKDVPFLGKQSSKFLKPIIDALTKGIGKGWESRMRVSGTKAIPGLDNIEDQIQENFKKTLTTGTYQPVIFKFINGIKEGLKYLFNKLTNTTADSLKNLPEGSKLMHSGFNPFDRTLWKNAWDAARRHANTFINWFNTKFPAVGAQIKNVTALIAAVWKGVGQLVGGRYGKLVFGGGMHALAGFSKKYAGGIAEGPLQNLGNFAIGSGLDYKAGSVFKIIKDLLTNSAARKGLIFMLWANGKLPEMAGLLVDVGAKLGGIATGFFFVGTAAIKGISTAIQAVKQLYVQLKEFGKLEQGYRAFFNIVTNSGADATLVMNSLRKATMGAVDDATLRRLGSTGMLLGIEPRKLAELAEIAGPAAVALGEDITSMFDSIIRGTARQSPLILDNLGISLKDLTSKEEEYAASLGKTAQALTDEEKRTFFVNFVLSKKEEILKKVGSATAGLATNLSIFEAKMKNMSDATSLLLAEGLIPTSRYLISIADQIDRLSTSMPQLKLATGAFGLALVNQANQEAAAFSAGAGLLAATIAGQSGRFDVSLYYLRETANTLVKAARGTPIQQNNAAANKPTKESKVYGETPAELKDRVKSLNAEVNTLFSQLYESEYNHRIKQAKATLDEELKLYKDSFEGQRLARKKHYLAVAAINKEFAEKRAEEIKREVEAEAQSVEQRLAELEKEQEEYRKEIEAVMEDSQQSLQVIEEIEDLKVEALGKGFANQLAEIDRWRDKQLDKYRDWKEAEVLIELIAQQRKREIIEEYQKKADEDREAEIEKTRTSVEEAIDAINSAYEEAADRMKSVTDSIKTSFEELLNIFGNTQNRMTGFVAFLGSTFGSVISEAAGIFGKFAKAEKGASKDGVKGNDSLGESFKKLGANVIESLKQQAVVQAVMEFAAGLQALARLDFRAAGLHFASSALYGTIAAMQIATALGAGGGGGGNYYNNSANEPGGGSYTYSLDNVNPNTGTNVTIYAMDSQSFSDFANRNKGAFAGAVEGALRNNISRRKIGNNL